MTLTPTSYTSRLWQVAFTELPHPVGLPDRHDVVRTGMGLGLPALEAMLERREAVGPILCCPSQQVVIVPVAAGTADVWAAPHSLCRPGAQWHCTEPGYPSCSGRLWISGGAAITEAAALHHSLSLTRSRLRSEPARLCGGHRVQVSPGVAHV
ncbi:hypothetical protein ABZ883_38785 [Streptomyces sp. NPDC046977]|uniref:hypothetical protein n=1 Tax=Streptomyces sp. NPDC046977 TaxID=3154703 RepID=UPI0033D2D407